MPKTTFSPVGHCIYCGDTSSPLTLEHIVPFGLGGDLELPASSCNECAKITGAFIEQAILRQMLIKLRVGHNLPTRNKKNRPDTFEVFIVNPDGSTIKKEVNDPNILRNSWILPVFEPPGFVQQVSPEECELPKLHCEFNADDAAALVKHGGGKLPVEIVVSQFSIPVFARMLAKIAHSFAYALLGKEGFSPVLETFILNDSDKYLFWIGCDWVGCSIGPDDGRRAEPHLFRLTLFEIVTWNGFKSLAVGVRLFHFWLHHNMLSLSDQVLATSSLCSRIEITQSR